jgi:hypothetical protein
MKTLEGSSMERAIPAGLGRSLGARKSSRLSSTATSAGLGRWFEEGLGPPRWASEAFEEEKRRSGEVVERRSGGGGREGAVERWSGWAVGLWSGWKERRKRKRRKRRKRKRWWLWNVS